MWTILSRWFTQEIRSTRRHTQAKTYLNVETLEGRCLHSVSSVLATLRDPGVVGLTKIATYKDQRLERTEMISLFRAVAQDGVVTATELKDLTVVVASAHDFNMDLYVQDLAKNVVSANPANKHFQGHTLCATGQFTAGNTGTQLNRLVDKWFLGRDLPLAKNDVGIVYSYQSANGHLFAAAGPSNLDIHQGYLGDCYFLSTLGETAVRAPQAIRNMFLDNHDGTFTVRFFHQVAGKQQEEFVTVNRQVPVDAYGRFIFANMGQSIASTNNVLWVSLAEKAYAQLAEEGWSRIGYAAAANNYTAIIGGSGFQPLQEILGQATSYLYLGSGTASTLLNDVASGMLITIGSKGSPANHNVIGYHEYYVAGYDAKSKTFTIVNPWGAELNAIGTLHLTASQVLSSFDFFDICATPVSHVAWHK